MAEKISPPRSSRATRVLASCAAFLAIGYFLTSLLGDARPAMVVAVALSIPFGVRASSVRKGLLWGGGLGLLAGLTIAEALSLAAHRPAPPHLAGFSAAVLSAFPAGGTGGLETLGAVALSAALAVGYEKPLPLGLLLLHALMTAGMCAVAAGIFAYLGRRRRDRMDASWR